MAFLDTKNYIDILGSTLMEMFSYVCNDFFFLLLYFKCRYSVVFQSEKKEIIKLCPCLCVAHIRTVSCCALLALQQLLNSKTILCGTVPLPIKAVQSSELKFVSYSLLQQCDLNAMFSQDWVCRMEL